MPECLAGIHAKQRTPIPAVLCVVSCAVVNTLTVSMLIHYAYTILCVYKICELAELCCAIVQLYLNVLVV